MTGGLIQMLGVRFRLGMEGSAPREGSNDPDMQTFTLQLALSSLS